MSDGNQRIIEEFRANEGRVGGYFEDKTLLLLHTSGAKSGQPRINPLVTLADGDRYLIIASKGGAPTNPAWYYNVVANPQVGVEMGSETFQAQAAVAEEPERTELYGKMAAKYPFFSEYERNTERVIPVIILERLP